MISSRSSIIGGMFDGMFIDLGHIFRLARLCRAMPAQPVANRSITSQKGSSARRASLITQRLYLFIFSVGINWDSFWPRFGDYIYAAVNNAAYNAAYNAANKNTTNDAANATTTDNAANCAANNTNEQCNEQ